MLATDRKAVMGVGEPSYTSGAHIWKGTLEILNPNPAIMSTMPKRRAWLPKGVPLLRVKSASRSAMTSRDVLPVKPYTTTMPYSRTAELMALRIRNFIADSPERLSLRNAASAAIGSVVSSSEM